MEISICEVAVLGNEASEAVLQNSLQIAREYCVSYMETKLQINTADVVISYIRHFKKKND